MAENAWHLIQSSADEQHGPVSDADLLVWMEGGHVQPDYLLWRDGMSGWEPAAVFLDLFAETTSDRDGPENPMAPEASAEPAPADPQISDDGAHALGKLAAETEAPSFGPFLGRKLNISEPDLADFTGTNPEPFLAYRQKLINNAGGFAVSFTWPALFIPAAWLAYRRLYGWAAIYFVWMIAQAVQLEVASPFTWHLMGVTALFHLALCIFGKGLIILSADKAAELANGAKLHAVDRQTYLQANGGVSKLSLWIVVVAYIVMALVQFAIAYPPARNFLQF